jgi:hypothetical protein
MFKYLFGNPIKKLRKIHAKLSEQAMFAQRNGKMALFAELSSEADEIYNKIIVLEKEKSDEKN